MTTYYISPSGNDANNGLGPDASHASNKPWLTFGKALGAAGIASGDTVYIAPGTYRECVDVAMTSATGQTIIEGDPLNAQSFKNGSGVLLTGGPVIWTAYTSGDTSNPAADNTVDLAGRDFLTFRNIRFVGGSNTSGCCVRADTSYSSDITFTNCSFRLGVNNGNLVNAIAKSSAPAAAMNWLFDRCRFLNTQSTCVVLSAPTLATGADYDVNVIFSNCIAFTTGNYFVQFSQSASNTFKPGGVVVINCTVFAPNGALNIANAGHSTSITSKVYNCIILGANFCLNTATANALVEDYNYGFAGTPRNGTYAAIANSLFYGNIIGRAPMFSIMDEFLDGMLPRPFLYPDSGSPLLGFGSGGSPPSVDGLNRPRPAGGASTSLAVGAFERHDSAVQETSVTQAGSSAAKIVGPGDHDFQIPVDASLTTISVYVRYDTNHATTNKPQIILLANGGIGVATETKTATVGVDTWEQLTFTNFTPTAKGFVTVRCVSRSAAGNGIAYFDTASGGAQGSQDFDYFRMAEPLQALVATGSGGGGGIKVHPGMNGGVNG